MKKLILIQFLALVFVQLKGQVTLFSDDFESGTANWNIIGFWGQTNEKAYSGSYSFTDSPYSTYYNGTYEQVATMNSGVNLSSYLDAEVSFYAQIDLETGFDFMYLDASPDGGASWFEVAVFNGEGMFTWTEYTFSLGAFVGNSDVRLRFRFEPDLAYEVDGMYIDDFTITGSDVDNSPPLILYTPQPLYEATSGANTLTASVIDGSGISTTTIYYNVDGGAYSSVAGVNIGGGDYSYTIPAQEPGSFVSYYITATDAYVVPNMATSQNWDYISGDHIFYDDAAVGADASVYYIGELATQYAAVKISPPGPIQLVSVIIRTYTDISNPNDSLEIHIWNSVGGSPGTDIITPFKVWPEATLGDPYRGTRVDLRDYAAELTDISDDFFIGFTVSGAYVGAVYSNTGVINHSKDGSLGSWFDLYGDFQFRAVTISSLVPPDVDFSFEGDPAVTFTDLSTHFPTSWDWDFGDGTTSTSENPTHTYVTNGTYTVCLTATNAVGSNTTCKDVTISSIIYPPIAEYSYSIAGTDVSFTDLSSNVPTSWYWTFGDGTNTSSQNPTHTYPDFGSYTVCLSATNAGGTSTAICKVLQVVTGIDNITSPNFSIYPNPATSIVYIDFDKLQGEKYISLINCTGSIVANYTCSSNSITLPVSGYASGMYILQVKTDNSLTQSKILITK